jgi:hypothetical protein
VRAEESTGQEGLVLVELASLRGRPGRACSGGS